ncbi:tyrosine-protein phosphatase [Natribacillus halophilus]|uniref:Tyrosine-protein phosphatase n=1 Tax=Natribacillus halophilus TaxID=549003 RepID=A0A1G8KHE4_9BACI|nr:CpsB/CapC family capsule biosynthesis tyrosine phosphatase [Natribacillus halophilus]SDI42300.1 protein-tyrosine phosphatase [Natribacillus halophilus]
MIDIHSHILPGVDDGAPHMQESLAMARQAVDQGITHIIATPHHRNGHFDNEKKDIITHTQALNDAIVDERLPLMVHPGQETRVYGEMIDGFRTGELCTLADGGRYLFVELPSDHVPRYTGRLLYHLLQEEVIPVIVHPERNIQILKDASWLYEMVKSGVATQVTAASITGDFGKTIRKFSQQLIEHNLAHFVASDTHTTSKRPNRLRGAYEVMEKKYGTETVLFYQENAEFLLNHQYPMMDEPQRIKKKKAFGLFSR